MDPAIKPHFGTIASLIGDTSTEDIAIKLLKARGQLSPEKYSELLQKLLVRSFSRGCSDLVIHLVRHEEAPLANLEPSRAAQCPSVPVLNALSEAGWDVLQVDHKANNNCLIDMVVEHEASVRWLIEHGAKVDRGQFDDEYALWPRPAPLLETCASFASLDTFKLIHNSGARISRRTLHKAAEGSACAGADPGKPDGGRLQGEGEGGYGKEERAKVLRYLVEEIGLNINQLDSDSPRHFHWGTPINYAAKSRYGASTVAWLLEKGADPSILGLDSSQDAEGIAAYEGSKETVMLIQAWKRKHEK
ncbi:hypothetical protein BGW36DRAFT_380624 [Talaromyces proteolyticus]|uniref:Ankyrin n=1 Tax=Talaromyces proteolyticus TaxID=1131652 RepID=A0AAD4PZD6_9EURO|nr:uncharacterized protein BGW36DRAFT_380624 [Talaromyces proteolyticus]KAH8696292.1 hypothetical protein BGW36DRAFT_380624 [Talaromyces proteolyticus]